MVCDLYQAIDVIIVAQIKQVKPTVDPYSDEAPFVPKELQDGDIQALAPVVVLTDPEAGPTERYVVKVSGKWYINMVYYGQGDTDVSFYPGGEEWAW